ncbi:MAG: Tic20 family protein [Geitlerinemataceae cyanobacterium]
MNDNMPWSERIGAAAFYLIPLIESLDFAAFIFRDVPALQLLFVPLVPVIQIYEAIPLGRLIVFFGIFFGVVRNDRFSDFIRFNAMQALLVSIILSISGFLLSLLGPSVGSIPLLFETIINTLFLGVLAIAIYSMVQSVRGERAEIPAISEAADLQSR